MYDIKKNALVINFEGYRVSILDERRSKACGG